MLTKYPANCNLHKKQTPITLLETCKIPQDASFPKLTEKQHHSTTNGLTTHQILYISPNPYLNKKQVIGAWSNNPGESLTKRHLILLRHPLVSHAGNVVGFWKFDWVHTFLMIWTTSSSSSSCSWNIIRHSTYNMHLHKWERRTQARRNTELRNKMIPKIKIIAYRIRIYLADSLRLVFCTWTPDQSTASFGKCKHWMKAREKFVKCSRRGYFYFFEWQMLVVNC